MNRIRITPTDEQHWLDLRAKDLTSTDMAALFGCSPYSTLFEVWHRKREGVGSDFNDNDRMKWGRRLESAIARGIAEDQGWSVAPFKDYLRLPEHRIGSSFDFAFNNGGAVSGILEIKNVDGLAFKQTWVENDDGSIEAPPHIELQVQHQMLVAGHRDAYIGALVGGNRVVLIRREAQPDIQEAILAEAAKFWASIAEGRSPQPDFEKDAAFIASLYQHAEPGKLLDAKENEKLKALAMAYQQASHEEGQAKKAKEAAKAKMLVEIGDAEKVLGDGWSISAGVQGPLKVEAYERAGFRSFKVNFKKAAIPAA